MKITYAVLALALISTHAFADGFVCDSQEDTLVVKVFNHVHAAAGTRNAAVMVLSDSAIQDGNKTIARFTDTNETLENSSASYEAKVDLRYNDSKRAGELIGGTKLGQLDTIQLDVPGYRASYPSRDGAQYRGRLTLVKRNGDEIEIAMDCTRYLKN